MGNVLFDSKVNGGEGGRWWDEPLPPLVTPSS